MKNDFLFKLDINDSVFSSQHVLTDEQFAQQLANARDWIDLGHLAWEILGTALAHRCDEITEAHRRMCTAMAAGERPHCFTLSQVAELACDNHKYCTFAIHYFAEHYPGYTVVPWHTVVPWEDAEVYYQGKALPRDTLTDFAPDFETLVQMGKQYCRRSWAIRNSVAVVDTESLSLTGQARWLDTCLWHCEELLAARCRCSSLPPQNWWSREIREVDGEGHSQSKWISFLYELDPVDYDDPHLQQLYLDAKADLVKAYVAEDMAEWQRLFSALSATCRNLHATQAKALSAS